MWIFFAFLAPALYAVAEIFDEFFSNKGFKNIAPLIFFASLCNFVFVPILFIIQKPVLPTFDLIWPLIAVGLTNLLYLYPYYKSLKIEDTSVVSAFFSFGKIIIPIFAFVFIGEVLQLREYIGIGIIILGNVLLAFRGKIKTLKLSKAFYLIVLASTILAIDGILYKYMFEHGIGWSTAIGGQLILSGIIGCSFILSMPSLRMQLKEEKDSYRKYFKLFFLEEFFTFLAVGAEMYAIELAPVSLVKGIGMVIPIFVLLYTVAVKKYNPEAFREDINRNVVIKKILIFCIIVFGLFLIGVNE